ncbi:H(2)-dependent methylenetetrahydromethanopterin dehydrogenase-related protein [Methanothermococcus sp. SCGC AD-155-C09]|nr:H(2)-dependent methylenetetrahydromethanopterin dehydrogenase-related protein [Methanothermococcus sp. SCGC AD-155-C09]
MKISIYGAGNQKFYMDTLKLHEKQGGEPPFNGGAMAIEFAKAGHDVILSESDRSIMSEDLWKKIEESGVNVVNEDTVAAEHSGMHILTRPFSENTIKSIKEILLENIPKDSTIAITDSTPIIMLYSNIERELRLKRKDVGLISMCPNAIPGSELYSRYIMGYKSLDGDEYATEDQFNKFVDLIKSIGREISIEPVDVIPLMAGLPAHLSAVTLSGVLNYYKMKSIVTGNSEKISEREVLYILQGLASILETSGISGLLKALDVDIFIEDAKASVLLEEQKDLESAIYVLSNLNGEFTKEIGESEIKPVSIVASQALVEEIRRTIGGSAADGMISRCKKKFLT